ncbi:MAG: DNA helicase RecQ [Bacteroidota bacterium]
MTRMDALEALSKYFGYDSFRPQQLEIIEHVYAAQDGLVLMPTGGGKSVTFQIPAITMPGTTIVLSPLIALMKDQVDGLRSNGIRAAYINTSLQASERTEVEDAYAKGELDLLYVSPEKLMSNGFFQFLRRAVVNLFAIDEAHCISAWGHDFRPEYTQLSILKKSFPEVPILALTATADRLTRLDICKQLSVPDARQFIASFDRPNISLEVRPGQRRRQQIVQFLKEHPEQSGIIYCLSRKGTESLAAALRTEGFDAQHYHAGLDAKTRSQVQTDFIQDKTSIVCATIAFGMGIDKSNVRWVIHYNLPKNIENYYQEIGRAGRDGTKAETILFYSYNDYSTYQEMLGGNDNSAVALAKLDRMKEYAESLACRRRVLLNYFSEDQGEDCGNCDICRNPPQRFDGTIFAQKALSAVARLREQVGVGLLIDVLRGSGRKEIFAKGYHQVKTYGAGRDTSQFDWTNYLTQLINLGYLYVAHEDYHKLKLSPAAKRVLFEGEQVELVNFATLKERREAAKAKAKKTKGSRNRNPRTRDSLFNRLKELRLEIARENGKPPYIIFDDRALEEMAAMKPTTEVELARVNGVGQHKLALYGPDFLRVIRKELQASDREARGKTPSYLMTYEAFMDGEELAEIASRRGIGLSSAMSHLGQAYEAGKDFEIISLLRPGTLERVSEALQHLHPKKDGKKSLLDHIGADQINYGELQLALSYLARHDS